MSSDQHFSRRRTSARLWLSGYYAEDGQRTVSYKESRLRFKYRRRKKKHPPDQSTGHPRSPSSDSGQSSSFRGYFVESSGLPSSFRGYFVESSGLPSSFGGPSTASSGLPSSFGGPSTASSGLPSSFGGYSTAYPGGSSRHRFGYWPWLALTLICLCLCGALGVFLSMKANPVTFNPAKDTPFRVISVPLMPNHAIWDEGASVIASHSSPSYRAKEHRAVWDKLVSWSISPQNLVTWPHAPLEQHRCWSFAGNRGHIHIKLAQSAHLSHVTLGHFVQSEASNEVLSSAPRSFSVFGMKTKDGEKRLLGQFVFDKLGTSFQTFAVSDLNDDFSHVLIEVESNWGNSEYTCLYSVRVHSRKASEGKHNGHHEFITVPEMPNRALYSKGARVLRSHSSATYSFGNLKSQLWSFLLPKSLFLLQKTAPLLPEACWPFAGDKGHVHIDLAQSFHMSHVSLGHIALSQSPTGEVPSAPKDFSVYGMETIDGEEEFLGRFTYDPTRGSFQTFALRSHGGAFQHVRIKVESNWGNAEYTCIYNVRIHGLPAATP